ncbi:MAG: protein kinase [Planctomycetes bacterium]|nr:protein kinase [Planctomycetota bacterium]
MLDEHRKNRLMELFAEATELAPGDRQEFFARIADEPPELRSELIELLRIVDGDLADFLSRPIVAALPVDAATPVPEIPGYVDLQRIGEGGMSTVYRATQREPVTRTVAIKTIRPGLDSRPLLARFAAERQALARMAHPGIATVYDAGADQLGRPWLAMEFVDGQPLTDYCATHGLDVDARVELMARVCDAVDHAHRRGVLHRDLKPSNVLVVHDEHTPMPKVIDFGIAKALEGPLGDASIHTLDGALLGTPEYMSPEQLAGDGRAVDTRSDVYALGVMLYELIAGERPFDAERLRRAGLTDLLRIVRDEVPPKPSTRLRNRPPTSAGEPARAAPSSPRVRGDLDWVVMRALEKDPERRYATPRALAEDLRRFLANLPVEAGPPSHAYRLRKFVRRYRALVASSLVVFTTLVAGLVAVWLLAARNEQLAAGEAAARAAAETSNRVLRHNLYGSHMRLAAEAMHAPGGVVRARELLAAWLPEAGAEDLRGFEWHLLHARCHGELHVAAAEGHLMQLFWTPDDRLLSTHWNAANAWSAASGEHLGRWESPVRPVAAMAVDGAGRVLALSTSPTDVALRRIDSGEQFAVLRHAAPAYRAMFSRDGSLLLTKSRHAAVDVWDGQTGEHLADLAGGINGTMAASDDGRLVAVGAPGRGEVKALVFDRDDLQHPRFALRSSAEGAWQLDFDDGATRLAAVGDDGRISVWSLGDGALTHEFEHLDGLRCVSFDPSGRRLAVGCQDYVAYLHDLDSGETRQFCGHTGVVNAVAWSPDGSRLVTMADDATLRWWELDARPPHRTLQLRLSGTITLAQLAFLDGDQQLAVRADHAADRIWCLTDDSTSDGFRWRRDDRRLEAETTPRHDLSAIAPDGTLALFDRGARKLWLWPPKATEATPHEHPYWVRGAAWTNDGRLATIDGSDAFRVLDGETGRELFAHAVPQGPLGLAASPVADILAIAGADQSVWLVSSRGEDLGLLRGHTGHVNAVAFAPDGSRLASGSRDGTVRIWDVGGRAEVSSMRIGGLVVAVAFSHDGTRLAAIDAKGRIDFWDARDDRR